MSSSDSDRASLENSLAIDRICDEFESSCLKNQRPKIEEFLNRVKAGLRERLLEQLLYVELENQIERPVLAQYLQRFPDHKSVVEAVFEELDLVDWTGSMFGHFRLKKELARGGMGVVYLADDCRLEREVAIKLLTSGRRTDANWLRRFRREARLASALNHPNILTIFEVGEEQGTPFIATEFVDGETLRSVMSENSLSIKQVLDYARQISHGMISAHLAGIIHRDLKAENIMIRKDGILKILDFGLAKVDRTRQANVSMISKAGAISGTAHFMSPEQARGEELTGKSDVFSFGVLLYLMLTGNLPFSATSVSEVLAAVINSEPDSIFSHGVKIPEALDQLVHGCLQKSADERPDFSLVHERLSQIAENTSDDESRPGAAETVETVMPSTRSVNPVTKVDLSPSPIRYARSGEVNIAWQEIGSGPIDIVFVMGWVSHLDWFWRDPSFAEFLRRLAMFARVILFDKRGTGLSDKVPLKELPDLETRMDDVRAVMESAESSQAVLCGVSEGGPLCALFAATYPDKTIALTMIGSYSRRLWADDYPWGPTEKQREVFLREIADHWGGPLGIEERAPSKAEDPVFRDWWASYLRMGASPNAAVALTKMNAQIDIRPVLASIQVPTLVIHRSGDRCLKVEEGKYLADQITGAQFVELPGDDHLPFVGDSLAILNEIELFLTGMRAPSHSDCVLATVLCINLVAKGEDLVRRFQKMVKHEFALFRGQNVVFGNESILATFDGPVRSVLCALAVKKLAERLQLEVQCGLVTGTCNVEENGISGPAVAGAQKVATLAGPADVLVTSSLKNLISGSEISFERVPLRLNIDPFDDDLFKVSTS